MPGGRLTLTTGVPVIAGDVAGATAAYYTPVISNVIPIWSGSAWNYLTFAGDLTLTLNSTVVASGAIVDVFAIKHSGAIAIGTGPSWTSATPGAGSRGTGAGTTQLVRTSNGPLTNAVAITLNNGVAAYAGVPAGQATYLGSLYGDSTAGQVSCLLSWGQSRKWGVWNAYNRRVITMQCGDSTASWGYGVAVWHPVNANTANSITTFTGLAEEPLSLAYVQSYNVFSTNANTGLGVNSTTSPSGKQGTVWGSGTGGAIIGDATAAYTAPPSLGINTITALEITNSGSLNVYGTQAHTLLSATYNG